jgi:hypothetical protein
MKNNTRDPLCGWLIFICAPGSRDDLFQDPSGKGTQ